MSERERAGSEGEGTQEMDKGQERSTEREREIDTTFTNVNR